jgi:hypothetical protein
MIAMPFRQNRRRRSALLLCIALAFATTASAAPLRFFAVGDLPNSSTEAERLARLLALAAAEEPAFIVHVGDIKGGGQPCTDARNRAIAELFRAQPVPMVYTPGDNEWTDCHRLTAGRLDPLARLESLRRMFFADAAVLHNGGLGLTAPDPRLPENAWFIRDEVLFVVLHIVGSNNGWQPRNPPGHAEFEARSRANRALLDQALAAGQGAGARAVVLIFHANPRFERPNKPGYLAFKQDLARLLAHFDGPVLVIHGDTHSFKLDRPLRDPATGAPIARLQRLEVPGSPVVAGVWVSVDPDADEVFSVRTLYPEAR